MIYEQVVHRPAYAQVADQLREAILGGTLAAGSELPSERDLTERFGVGRTTIREALRSLQAQGLVVGGSGPTAPLRVVTPDALSAGPVRDGLIHLLRLGRVPLDDLIELRIALEGAAVGAAVARGSGGFDDARAELDAMRAAGTDVAAFEAADVRFHLALVAASGNEAFSLIMLAVRHSMAAHLLDVLQSARDPAPVVGGLLTEHEQILAAVEAGDAEKATALLRTHLQRFYQGAVR